MKIRFRHLLVGLVCLLQVHATAKVASCNSPSESIVVILDDTEGLHLRITVDGKPLLTPSAVGLDIADAKGVHRAGRQLHRHLRVGG